MMEDGAELMKETNGGDQQWELNGTEWLDSEGFGRKPTEIEGN